MAQPELSTRYFFFGTLQQYEIFVPARLQIMNGTFGPTSRSGLGLRPSWIFDNYYEYGFRLRRH